MLLFNLGFTDKEITIAMLMFVLFASVANAAALQIQKNGERICKITLPDSLCFPS